MNDEGKPSRVPEQQVSHVCYDLRGMTPQVIMTFVFVVNVEDDDTEAAGRNDVNVGSLAPHLTRIPCGFAPHSPVHLSSASSITATFYGSVLPNIVDSSASQRICLLFLFLLWLRLL